MRRAGTRAARVVWWEDGRLVDRDTAARPYEPPPHARAEVQRVLDAEARRLLDEADVDDGAVAS